MAAAKSGPAKGQKASKVFHGRMPVKRKINLTLINENRIDPLKAIPAILLILLLALVFGKFLVYDRINEAAQANSRVARLREDLDNAVELSQSFGEVEDVYAHYTIEGMTPEELGQVDRVEVLNMIRRILLANAQLSTSEFSARLNEATDTVETIQNMDFNLADIGAFIRNSFSQLNSLKQSYSNDATTWSLIDNVLTVNITGRSLETMNDVTQLVEQEPIVDTSIITTANKSDIETIENRVSARFVIYLKQPEEVGAK